MLPPICIAPPLDFGRVLRLLRCLLEPQAREVAVDAIDLDRDEEDT